jgi:hypothetical protein
MRVLMASVVALLLTSSASAEQRYAVLLSGASGGPEYAARLAEWRSALRTALVDRYGFPAENVRVLVDETEKTGERGTAANVKAVFADLRKRLQREDLVLLVMLGHGTYDGETAKFNLIGPDMTAQQWAALLKDLPGHLVVVNTTAASFPFLQELSGPNRVVITATDSPAQKYATVFPEYFVKALQEASSDLDKNGRTSIFEVFMAASQEVKRHYEQRAQLRTEHPVLDDNGDKVGRRADVEGPDGGMARLLYLDVELPAAANNPELAALLQRRRELEAAAEALKARKGTMADATWEAEYEKLMLELARLSLEIKQKGGQHQQ